MLGLLACLGCLGCLLTCSPKVSLGDQLDQVDPGLTVPYRRTTSTRSDDGISLQSLVLRVKPAGKAALRGSLVVNGLHVCTVEDSQLNTHKAGEQRVISCVDDAA